ncbi:MAG: putative holin-like toxin [Clostridia bacterium]
MSTYEALSLMIMFSVLVLINITDFYSIKMLIMHFIDVVPCC